MSKPRMVKPTESELETFIANAFDLGTPFVLAGGYVDADQLKAWREFRGSFFTSGTESNNKETI